VNREYGKVGLPRLHPSEPDRQNDEQYHGISKHEHHWQEVVTCIMVSVRPWNDNAWQQAYAHQGRKQIFVNESKR
jgi:hypothetical protein